MRARGTSSSTIQKTEQGDGIDGANGGHPRLAWSLIWRDDRIHKACSLPAGVQLCKHRCPFRSELPGSMAGFTGTWILATFSFLHILPKKTPEFPHNYYLSMCFWVQALFEHGLHLSHNNLLTQVLIYFFLIKILTVHRNFSCAMR